MLWASWEQEQIGQLISHHSWDEPTPNVSAAFTYSIKESEYWEAEGNFLAWVPGPPLSKGRTVYLEWQFYQNGIQWRRIHGPQRNSDTGTGRRGTARGSG